MSNKKVRVTYTDDAAPATGSPKERFKDLRAEYWTFDSGFVTFRRGLDEDIAAIPVAYVALIEVIEDGCCNCECKK